MVTLVVVNDGQKDPKLLDYCFKALSRNDLNKVQVIMLLQSVDRAYARALADEQPFDIEICESTGEIVDGMRMWDVFADLKAIRPRMTGEYLLYIHKEFMLEPDYFAQVIPWLEENKPDLAMANLMRLGTPDDIDRRCSSSCKRESSKVKRAVTRGAPFPDVKCLPWIFHRTPADGEWVEDAFFASLDWLDRNRFFDHADRMLFQDVFDLVGEIVKVTGESVPRIPVGRMLHLWHRKDYSHFTDAVIEYFASDPARWAGTCMADIVLMRQIQLYLDDHNGYRRNPIAEFRRNENGTVTRYMRAYKKWYDLANKPAPVDFVMRNGNPLLCVAPREWRDKSGPIRAMHTGLQAAGYTPTVLAVSPGAKPGEIPSFAVIWNGGKSHRDPLVEYLRGRGVPVLIMERGWLDRGNYTQLDWKGYNHRASWAARIARTGPFEGVERFGVVQGVVGPRKPIEARKNGYVLVLGQTEGDTQLNESEIGTPNVLLATVLNSTREKVVFRPHPANGYRPGGGVDIHEGELSDALDGARFCVTINSNSGNDALWAGIPVLCFGPALYEMAGAAMGTSTGRIANDIETMLGGWRPDDRRVLAYFHWLCARQWTNKELERGDVIARLVGELCP